jgi:hypothetical protein
MSPGGLLSTGTGATLPTVGDPDGDEELDASAVEVVVAGVAALPPPPQAASRVSRATVAEVDRTAMTRWSLRLVTVRQ